MKKHGMKKVGALLLSAALMVTALSACGGSNEVPVRGAWNGDVYTNEYLGMSFTLPEGWVTLSDEELSAQLNASGNLLEDYDTAILEEQTIMEMGANDPLTGATVNVCYENLKLSNNTNMTETEYLEISIESTISEYESMGLTVDMGDIQEVEWLGNSYHELTVKLSQDELFIEQAYYVRKMGNYMAYVIITTLNESTATVLSNFS